MNTQVSDLVGDVIPGGSVVGDLSFDTSLISGTPDAGPFSIGDDNLSNGYSFTLPNLGDLADFGLISPAAIIAGIGQATRRDSAGPSRLATSTCRSSVAPCGASRRRHARSSTSVDRARRRVRNRGGRNRRARRIGRGPGDGNPGVLPGDRHDRRGAGLGDVDRRGRHGGQQRPRAATPTAPSG